MLFEQEVATLIPHDTYPQFFAQSFSPEVFFDYHLKARPFGVVWTTA